MSTKAMFGQYLKGESPVHHLDARMKLVLSLVLVVVIFVAQGLGGLAVCAAFIVASYAVAGISAGSALRAVAPLLFIVVITALLNLFFVQGGSVLFEWWLLRVSEAGVASAVFIGIRLFLLLLGMSLLTLTTTTLDIAGASENLLRPLAALKVPTHELSMMMGIALRFLPQFVTELGIVYRAQVSRGATFSASPFKGGPSMVTALTVPLLTSAFRHAETLSNAMDARCYHGAAGQTRLRTPRLTRSDAIAALSLAALLACVIAANLLGL